MLRVQSAVKELLTSDLNPGSFTRGALSLLVVGSGCWCRVFLLCPGSQALGELTGKGVGCLLVVDPIDTRLLGTFTDGDLRRTLQGRGAQVLPSPALSCITALFCDPCTQQRRHSAGMQPCLDRGVPRWSAPCALGWREAVCCG